MSREALVVADASGSDAALTQALQRYGYTSIKRLATVAEALDAIGLQRFDLIFIPIDQTDELQLAAIDRASRRERHMGVIATGSRSDPDLMLKAMRAGIQEFLVRPLDMTDLVASVERLLRRTSAEVSNGQVFAVFSSKGGVGTTTIASNLAYSLSLNLREGRVAVVDLAMGGGDVSVLLNVTPPYNLGDLAQKIDHLDTELLNSVLVPRSEGLWVLAAPENPEMEELIDANVVTAVIQQLRSAFAFSVLDCERDLSDRTLAVLDAADRIILPTELKVPSLRSAQRSLAIFRRLGYPTDKLCVVVNRYQSGDVVTAADAQEVLKADIFFKLPNEYKVLTEAATTGAPVAVSHPDSRIAQAYAHLAAKLGGGEVATDSNGTAPKEVTSGRFRRLFSRKRS